MFFGGGDSLGGMGFGFGGARVSRPSSLAWGHLGSCNQPKLVGTFGSED